MDNTGQLKDFDLFFYYGQNDLDTETRHDVLCNLMQPKRSFFYNRSNDSCGITNYENKPVGLSMQVLLPYDIVSSISKRNQYVSNGENESKDRRVAISQSLIKINFGLRGEVDVTVLYIPLATLKQTDVSVSLNIGN